MKLPKQWKHWLKAAHLTDMSNRSSYSGWIIKGRDRHWRVNCNGVFECSCPLEHFDRWANSRGAESDHIPTSKADFLKTVNALLVESKDKR